MGCPTADIDPSRYGCLYEIIFGEKEEARLENATCERRRVYVYGSALTVAHLTLLYHQHLTVELLRSTMVVVLQRLSAEASDISSIMGIDGMTLFVDGNTVSIEQVTECKTSIVPNLYGTYKQSEAIERHGVKTTIRIVTPSGVRLNQADLRRMRELHKHTVVHEHFDPDESEIVAAFHRFYPPHQVDAPSQDAGSLTLKLRGWQNAQRLSLKRAWEEERRMLRLMAVMGSGKSIVNALNARDAPPQFRHRIISSSSFSGLEQMKSVFARLGEPFFECDHATDRKRKRTPEEPLMNVEDDDDIKLTHADKIHIQAWAREHACKGKEGSGSAARPPVLLCLHVSLCAVLEAFSPFIHQYAQLFLALDEAHKASCLLTRTILGLAHTTTLQCSGTFHDHDEDAPGEWIVEPYFVYSYADSVRDRVNVPIDVYFFDANELLDCESRFSAHVELSINILTLFPFRTMIVVSTIREARFHRGELCKTEILRDSTILCVHSRMSKRSVRNDGDYCPIRALERIRNTKGMVIAIFVNMANNNLDLPTMRNFIDHRASLGSVDAAAQKLARACRAGERKPSCNFFVTAREEDTIQMVKRRYDSANHISMRTFKGATLVEVATSIVAAPVKRKLLARDNRRLHRPQYRDAFEVFALEAIKRVQYAKDRKALNYSDETLMIPYKGDYLERSLRAVVEDIIAVHQKRSHLTLPADFCFPPFVHVRSGGVRCPPVNLKFVKMTAEQQKLLRSKEGERQLNEEEWSFLRRSAKTSRESAVASIEALRETGILTMQGIPNVKKNPAAVEGHAARCSPAALGKKKIITTLRCPEMKGFGICVDVDAVCKVVDAHQKETGIGEGSIQWIMQRVKLLQMGIVGHSEYEAKKAQEMARIKKHEEKTAKSEAAAPGPVLGAPTA